MSRKDFTNALKVLLQIAPLIMIAIMAVLYFMLFRNVTVQDILNFTPENTFIAILVILGMYALKSLSFFFPMLLIIVASGSIFPLWIAILVNIAGLSIQVTIPYFLGHFAEREFVEKLVNKHKSAEKLKQYKSENEFFISFILRVINITPCDLVSMLLGSMNVSYKKYILGSMAGIIPGMVFTTIVGSSLDDPTSPKFIISLCGDVAISAISIFIYWIIRKRKHKKLRKV